MKAVHEPEVPFLEELPLFMFWLPLVRVEEKE